jgi:hypothetical protein
MRHIPIPVNILELLNDLQPTDGSIDGKDAAHLAYAWREFKTSAGIVDDPTKGLVKRGENPLVRILIYSGDHESVVNGLVPRGVQNQVITPSATIDEYYIANGHDLSPLLHVDRQLRDQHYLPRQDLDPRRVVDTTVAAIETFFTNPLTRIDRG